MTDYIYGIHAVKALLNSHIKSVIRLVVQAGRDDTAVQDCSILAKKAGLTIDYLPRKDIDRLVGEQTVHQGVLLEYRSLPVYSEADIEKIVLLKDEPRLVLILDGIQDPHNLGACLRVANALGVCCVIAPKDRSVGLNATAIKVSCGAAFSTPFIQVTNLARAMRKLQDLELWLVGASLNTTQSLKDIDMRGNIGIVLGAEGAGLRELTEKHCDFLAKIPMLGTVESLNVSVATGIVLYEVYRQRI